MKKLCISSIVLLGFFVELLLRPDVGGGVTVVTELGFPDIGVVPVVLLLVLKELKLVFAILFFKLLIVILFFVISFTNISKISFFSLEE